MKQKNNKEIANYQTFKNVTTTLKLKSKLWKSCERECNGQWVGVQLGANKYIVQVKHNKPILPAVTEWLSDWMAEWLSVRVTKYEWLID